MRTLHGRQAATTLSQVCRPPRLRGTHVVDGVGVGAAVLAAVPVAGHHGAAAHRDPPAERHVHELAQAHDRRHWHLESLGVEHQAGGVDAVGLARRARAPTARRAATVPNGS